ncbi:MAG: response regulator transcription factor [Phycisphaerae bacterium]|nr:response regulator transcription factor [Phycisphaerae bacterium]
MVDEPRVFVLDDDPSVRERLAELLTSVRIRGEGFTAPTEFLKAYDPSVPGCLVLDVRLPEMSGLELHRRLVSQGALLPVIYLTAHADVALAVDAMKLGAVDFLEKPSRDQALLDAIQRGLEKAVALQRRERRRRELLERFGRLSPIERKVADRLVEGRSSKQIARELGISPKTVDFHKQHILEKTEADGVTELVRLRLDLQRHQECTGSTKANGNDAAAAKGRSGS